MKFKLTHNINKVSAKIDKSLIAKNNAIYNSIDKFVENSKKDAENRISSNGSVYSGKLRNSLKINKKIVKRLKGTWILKVDAIQGAFVEFGTKGKANPPARLSAYASQFKGMKGEGGNVIERLTEYFLSKNVPDGAIGAAINSVLKEGTKPHPFFFSSIWKNQRVLRTDLKKALKKKK
jgi:hypothetical protein